MATTEKFDDVIRTRTWHPRVDATQSSVARRALVLPGNGYHVGLPLLHWTCEVLHAGGWYVHVVDWESSGIDQRKDGFAFVERAAERLELEAPSAPQTLVVGKSLGTFAVPWAAERGYPGIWLTPVLQRDEIANGLATYPAPSLVVGGTDDRACWRSDAPVSGDRVEVEGADHSIEIGEDWRASMDAHRTVMDAVDRFAQSLQLVGAAR